MGSNRKVSAVDRHIAAKLKAARTEKGIPQTAAAEALGITFQQLQKYEWEKNRITAGRLYELAVFYEKPISWFFPKPKPGNG